MRIASVLLLVISLVAVVGLAKVLSPALEAMLEAAGAPRAVVGIVIAHDRPAAGNRLGNSRGARQSAADEHESRARFRAREHRPHRTRRSSWLRSGSKSRWCSASSPKDMVLLALSFLVGAIASRQRPDEHDARCGAARDLRGLPVSCFRAVTQPRTPKGFWDELLRRRVVRTALYYVAGAWVLAQATDLLLDAFDASHYMRFVIAALVIGLPLVLALAWMFDLTPRGIERTHEVPAPEMPAAIVPPPERSIAVLPFANLSQEAENEYFSEGLAEEIRNQLAREKGLRVAARSSSFAFKGRQVDAREIGRRLNVATVLEGGVRKQSDTVRIDVQLVNAADGFQLWAETFERTARRHLPAAKRGRLRRTGGRATTSGARSAARAAAGHRGFRRLQPVPARAPSFSQAHGDGAAARRRLLRASHRTRRELCARLLGPRRTRTCC